MARQKKDTEPEKSSQDFQIQKIFDQIKLSESYVSLILGAVVVLVLAILFFVFIVGNNKRSSGIDIPENLQVSPTPSVALEKTYILQERESIWDVAVKFYGDGYRYTEIIEANKFENPDYIPPGAKLIIPNAK